MKVNIRKCTMPKDWIESEIKSTACEPGNACKCFIFYPLNFSMPSDIMTSSNLLKE
jgi:hypothetical protein